MTVIVPKFPKLPVTVKLNKPKLVHYFLQIQVFIVQSKNTKYKNTNVRIRNANVTPHCKELWKFWMSFFCFFLCFCKITPPPFFWNFSENSSVLETPPFPKDDVNCFVNQHQSGPEKLQQYGCSGQIFFILLVKIAEIIRFINLYEFLMFWCAPSRTC